MLFETLILCSFLSLVYSDGIEVTAGDLKGNSFTCTQGISREIKWKVESGKYADKDVEIWLYKDKILSGKDNKVAKLGQVPYAQGSFNFLLNTKFPDSWQTMTKLNNDGTVYNVLIELHISGMPDVNSQGGWFARDPVFKLSCCPARQRGCPCTTPDTCQATDFCDLKKKICSKIEADGSHHGKCRTSDPKCDGDHAMCESDGICYVPTCPEGTVNCPCIGGDGGTCNSGNTCTKYGICWAGGVGSLEGAACTQPGFFNSATQTAKLSHPCSLNAKAMPLACRDAPDVDYKTCQACAPGSADCLCAEGNSCTSPGYQCVDEFCIPLTGCEGCPCHMPSSLCDGDLICFNRVCTAKKVPTPPPTIAACSEGSENCACIAVTQGDKTRYGCSRDDLQCLLTDQGQLCLVPPPSPESSSPIVALSMFVVLAVAVVLF